MDLFLTLVVCCVEIKLWKTLFKNFCGRAFDIVLMSVFNN